jgi:hypothetical protein
VEVGAGEGLATAPVREAGSMKPFAEFPPALCSQIRFVLCDVDDTLTDGPRLPAAAYTAIERLQAAGIVVIPVTAAPAGWCDLMARMWPVGAVIGENGGLCFRDDRASGIVERRYWAEPAERDEMRSRLAALGAEIAAALPGSEIAHDQRYAGFPQPRPGAVGADPGAPAQCRRAYHRQLDLGTRVVR